MGAPEPGGLPGKGVQAGSGNVWKDGLVGKSGQ
jgi:hypothetical protein